MRLLAPGRLAVLTMDRLNDGERRRARYRLIGLISVCGSVVAAFLYFLVWKRQPWLGLAAVVGLLSGFEMVANAATKQIASLKSQNVIFGVCYAASAVVTWYVLLR